MYKFVLESTGDDTATLYILRGGYHMDTKVYSGNVMSAGYIDINDDDTIEMYGRSIGYGVGANRIDEEITNRQLKELNCTAKQIFKELSNDTIYSIDLGCFN